MLFLLLESHVLPVADQSLRTSTAQSDIAVSSYDKQVALVTFYRLPGEQADGESFRLAAERDLLLCY